VVVIAMIFALLNASTFDAISNLVNLTETSSTLFLNMSN
jgi:hypothetical protein